MEDVRDLIIIGGGPAGYTAALYAARANLKPLLIEGFSAGGQLMITTDVENYPGFPAGDHGPGADGELPRAGRALRRGVHHRRRDAGRLLRDAASGLRSGDDEYRAKAVIIATGATARQLGLPERARAAGPRRLVCAVCDARLLPRRSVVVVGGGDSAMEEARSWRSSPAR